MIAKLTGVVDSLGEGRAVIDVAGVGYLVFCSSRTLARLNAGEAASLQIETHVREDHIHLYGFRETAEQDWFRLLVTVQGVGAKVGLALLGLFEPDQLVHAIAAGDKAAITRASGVGPKLAGRIISELKDKVGAMVLGRAGVGGVSGPPAGGGVAADAASVLVNLGYNASQALGAVSHAAAKLGGDVGVEALVRGGLAELSRGELAR